MLTLFDLLTGNIISNLYLETSECTILLTSFNFLTLTKRYLMTSSVLLEHFQMDAILSKKDILNYSKTIRQKMLR